MPSGVADALTRFFKVAAYPMIFTGAGVSVRAGLPTWKQLLEQLAEGLRASDPLTTQQMLEYIKLGNYTVAADYFKLSRKLVEGDKQRLITRLLSTFTAAAILPVARLPFRGCLTTNFDRSILDAVAIAKSRAARDYKFGDLSFKQAQWEESLFVARVHGSVEMPDSMVLSESQFNALLNDDTYADLLRACFLHRNVLFLGFSFYDPAVRHVLDELNKRFGPAAPGRHIALLPEDAGPEFVQKAGRLNIEVVQYDPRENHAALWDGLCDFNRKKDPFKPPAPPSPPGSFGFTRRFLAACYARARTQGSSTALRVALVEGIVSAVLQEVAPKSIRRADLLEKIRLALGLRGRDAESIVDGATRSLIDAGLCRKLKDDGGRGTKLAWIGAATESDSLDSAIEVLTKSLVNRAYIQEGWKTGPGVKVTLTAFFNHLIRRRGWDLGAAFAAGRAPESVAIESLLNECSSGLAAFDRERLLRICESMLQHPSEEEATVLAELGRISFAVELAFQSPQSVLLHKAILPRRIYFDASVLLPAIVEGHPYSRLYIDAITRLKDAAAAAVIDLKCKVCTVYLNEIISHRRNAEDYSAEFGDEFPAFARSDALFHGITNLNVFVGAYANWLNNHEAVPFKDFLSRFAPYSTEAQLKRWLTDKGFEVVDSIKGPDFPALYSLLERAYADGLSRGKGPILIEHDATQLSILNTEVLKGENALFVTADRKLQLVTAESRFSAVAGMMISHVGLIQFIELLLGGIGDGAGLTEMLWSARISDRALAVRSYFTSRGLEQYDDGMAMAMPKIIEQFTDAATKELERTGADLDAEEPKKRAVAFRSLGSLEKNYLSGMRDAVAKLRAAVDGVS